MRGYSPAVMAHFGSPRNVGGLEQPDAEGIDGTPGAGNYMVLQARVEGDVLVEVRFQTFGCPAIISCGSVTTELVTGKTLGEAREVDAAVITEALGGLPLGKQHCAGLAANALMKLVESVERGMQ